MKCKHSFLQFKVAVIAMFLMPLISGAQESTEFFSLSYSQAAAANFNKSPGNATIGSLESNLITPTIKLGKNTNINNLLTYKFTNYNFDAAACDAQGYPKSLTDIQYSLLVRQALNEQWTMYVLPQVTARSDFEHKFTSGDLFASMSLLAIRKSKKYEKLEMGYGISYSQDYTKNTISPLFTISYSTPKFRLEALLPIKAQFVLTPVQLWEYGLEINLKTAIYRSDMPNPEIKYIRTINVPINFSVARKIYGMLWAKADAGVLLSRQYDVVDNNFRIMKEQVNTIDPSPYATIGISLRTKK